MKNRRLSTPSCLLAAFSATSLVAGCTSNNLRIPDFSSNDGPGELQTEFEREHPCHTDVLTACSDPRETTGVTEMWPTASGRRRDEDVVRSPTGERPARWTTGCGSTARRHRGDGRGSSSMPSAR